MSLAALVDAAQQAQINRYTVVSAVTLVTYEFLIRLDSEVCYLWRRRISFAGILLFLCRYLPFLAFTQVYVYVDIPKLDKSNCITGVRASICFVYVEFLVVVLVLFTRAYAVWGGSRKIFFLLAFVHVGGTVGTGYSIYLFIRAISFVDVRIGGQGCIINVGSESLWIALVILIVCESLALALLLVKSVQHARRMKNVLHHSDTRRNILLIMAQDGIGYFACTLAITTANIIVLERFTWLIIIIQTDLRNFLFVMQTAIQCILCARLLFHIHAVSEYPEGTYLSQFNISFAAIEMTPRKPAYVTKTQS